MRQSEPESAICVAGSRDGLAQALGTGPENVCLPVPDEDTPQTIKPPNFDRMWVLAFMLIRSWRKPGAL